MAKKKNKPDFSRPKEEVLEEKRQKAAERPAPKKLILLRPAQ